MAVTRQDYTQTGSTTTYVVPFVVIEPTDIDVYVNAVLQLQQNTTSTADATHPQVISGEITQGTALTNYTVASNNGTFTFNAVLTAGDYIVIERTTDDTSAATFVSGSTIRAKDLNDSFDQIRFLAEEAVNTANRNVIESRERDNSYTAQGYKIENLADADTDDDAVNRAQLGKVITDDLLEGEAIDLTDVTGGTNSNKQVTISVEDSSKTNKGAVSINEAHAIGVAYTNGDAVISADKSTASQQGVVKITTPSVTDGNPITLTRPADGEIELTIANDSIDVQKIKGLDKATTSEYSSNWTGDDDQVATVGALAARLDAVVSTSQPTTLQIGKFWYNPTEGINALYMWNGTDWKVLTSGTPYIPAGTTIVRYVDQVNGSDDVNNLGFLPQSPLKTIKRAITLINASASGDGTLVVVEPGVYQEALPLTIQKNNVSVVGKSLRSCFIHPTVATENSNMWEVDSGTYISGFTMLGLKVPTSDQGSRNNTLDNDATYGLPSNQPFAVSFRSGNPVILKSPYVQNCTHFSDAHFDNANFDPNTFPSTDAQTYSAVAGDQTSAPCGGGLLVDGSVPATTSPIRSMVVDAFTQITLDGPGILVTNNGYAQLVSFFGTFCHYHAKAKNGGQINLSNCVTDFGRYGLIAEGKSPTAIASATASAASSGATTVTIGAITSAASFHGTVSRPLDHMMLTVDGNDYGVVSSVANGSGWDVTITPALSQTISNTAVTFALRSYISTGGHTFEYVGVGTDYSDHPDNGGVAIEANQVKQFSGGKVWQSSTDHIGKFKAGSVLTVDQIAETLAVNGSITVTGTNAVNGNITVTGTVDGRDVATDGTKLDGIATGATAYANSDVDAHLNQSTASSGELLSWNGSDYDWIAAAAGYSDSSVDTHLNQSTAATGEVLSWNGSDYDWVASGGLTNNSSNTQSIGVGTNALDSETSGSENTAFGFGAGTSVTSGSSNVIVGRTAGSSLTTGSSNVLIGGGSTAEDQTSASACTIVGSGAGADNNAGNAVFIGHNAGRLNTSGTNNTAVGSSALYSNTTGSNNVASGYQALYNNTTGYSNTAVGWKALEVNTTGSSNTAVGVYALGLNTTAVENTAVGISAGNSVTTGNSNTFLGRAAGTMLTTGASNVIIGIDTAEEMTTASGCTLVGGRAGFKNNADYSVFIGHNAGRSNTSGANNTATGSDSLYANTTGAGNSTFGYEAGNSITTGGNNIVIGNTADASSATVSNEITLGNASITSLRIPGLQSGAADGSVLTYNSSNGNIDLVAASGLSDTSTASNSLGVGTNALDSETGGSLNTAFGTGAGTAITDGTSNVIIGAYAGTVQTTAHSNTFVGYVSGRYATAGNNTFYGTASGGSTTTGTKNVASGAFALYSNTTGSHNTANGYYARGKHHCF